MGPGGGWAQRVGVERGEDDEGKEFNLMDELGATPRRKSKNGEKGENWEGEIAMSIIFH